MSNIGDHPVRPFVTPVNRANNAVDANEVRGNDEALRRAYVAHDADATIHVQSSALAARPAAGVAGRVWVTVDSGVLRLWYDDGALWVEAAYLPLSGGTVSTPFVLTGLPTSAAGLPAGAVWNNGGILSIV